MFNNKMRERVDLRQTKKFDENISVFFVKMIRTVKEHLKNNKIYSE